MLRTCYCHAAIICLEHPASMTLNFAELTVQSPRKPLRLELRTVPASLSVFRIGGDGKLEYVRKYDVDVGNASMFWRDEVHMLIPALGARARVVVDRSIGGLPTADYSSR
jgi:hypothetical protein